MAVSAHINHVKASLSLLKHRARRRAKKWLTHRQSRRRARDEHENESPQPPEPNIPRVPTQRFYSSANLTPNVHAKMPPAISSPSREYSEAFCDFLHMVAGIVKLPTWLRSDTYDASHNSSSTSLAQRAPSVDAMESLATAATSMRSEPVAIAVALHPILDDFLFQPQTTSGHYSPPPSAYGDADAESYHSESNSAGMTRQDLVLDTNLELARLHRFVHEAVAISEGSVDLALAVMNNPDIVADIRLMAERHRLPIESFRGSERRYVFRSSRAGFTADHYANSSTAISPI